MSENILDAKIIKDKYEKIYKGDTTDLLIKTSYNTIDEFIISKRNQCNEIFIEDNDRKKYNKFLSYLGDYVKIYKNNILSNIKDNNNCAYAHLSLLSSIPTISDYSFNFEDTFIQMCMYGDSFFLDDFYDNILNDDFKDVDTLIKEFVKDFFNGRKILQIKNIDKRKKIKILCDGNYFVLDRRILMNETSDMRSDYEKLMDNIFEC